jgi:hypothetical protein
MTDGNRGDGIAITFPIETWMKVVGLLHFGLCIV